MIGFIKRLTDMFWDLLFPKRCVSCGEHISFKNDFLCPECRKLKNEEIDQGCPGCGKPYRDCRCKPNYLAGKTLITTMPYKSENSVCRDLIILCKRRKNRRVINELAEGMARALKRSGINGLYSVTFTPRSPKAVRKCGFDQAEELARQLAKKLSFPFVRTVECRDTNMEQKFLTHDMRQSNALKRFFIPKRRKATVDQASFILVDDVVTSGATLNRCADLLYESGASNVICIGAARAVGDNQPSDGDGNSEKENE